MIRNIRRPVFLLVSGLTAGILAGCAQVSSVAPVAPVAPVAKVQPASAGDCHRAESQRFVFHSDPWINLHHFLFEWARNVPERLPGDRDRAVDVRERTQLGNLEEGDRRVWERALAFYRERLVSRDLLFDRGLIALRGQMAALACSGGSPDSIEDAELRTVLVDAMPVYRKHWWPAHDGANRAWIQERQEDLRSYEAALSERLARAYGGEWPAERIRVDVAAYANWAGAYTTNRPNQVTVSAPSYQGLQGLEILFHEASHASFFEQRLLGQLADAFRRREAEMPGRLFHTIQFATPPELLRSVLPGEEAAGYRSVAERVYGRGSGADEFRIVLEHWKPFLDGKIERAEALGRIAAAITAR